MSRYDIIATVLEGLRGVEALQGIPIEPGFVDDTGKSTYIAVGPQIDGRSVVPTMKQGRKHLDQHWPLRVWICSYSQSRDGMERVARRYHDMAEAIFSWLQDNVSSVDGTLSVAGDDGDFSDSMTGPTATEDGFGAFGFIEIPIHVRLT